MHKCIPAISIILLLALSVTALAVDWIAQYRARAAMQGGEPVDTNTFRTVLWYQFGDYAALTNGYYADSSPRGSHATQTVSELRPEPISNALYFTGSQWFSSGDPEGSRLGYSNFILSCWAYALAYPASPSHMLFGRSENVDDNTGYKLKCFYYNSAARYHFQGYASNGTLAVNAAAFPGTETNSWHYVVVVRSNLTVSSYMDGVRKSEYLTNLFYIPHSALFTVGGESDGGQCYNGWLDDVRLDLGTITSNEILMRYNEGRTQ